MSRQKIAVLGSTGNIGKKTLKILYSKKKFFSVEFLLCDKNYKEVATNFVGNTKVEVLTGDEYYETYEDAFGDIAYRDNSL